MWIYLGYACTPEVTGLTGYIYPLEPNLVRIFADINRLIDSY